ncbi:hypothetical protein ACU4HD_12695 [Cupriavidus basilensis]
MANGKFVTYYRVSTQKQGQSGLGIEAQQKLVQTYLNGGDWQVLAEYTEVETGKGADALVEATQAGGGAGPLQEARRYAGHCQAWTGWPAAIHFISGLLETGVDFVAADMRRRTRS